MRKDIMCLLMSFIMVFSLLFSVFASEITDDALITKELVNGVEIQVHSNPYISEGMTELEFGIIEKMRETATEIGFDIYNDSDYQFYENLIYNQLFYSGEPAINAEQLSGVYEIIEKCGQMLKSKTAGKVPTENTIGEGFYAGVTEAERDTIRREVFDEYACKAIMDLGIYNRYVGFDDYSDVVKLHEYVLFKCNKDMIDGDNFLVETELGIDQYVYDSIKKYFDDSCKIKEIKTYPENNKLMTEIAVGLVPVVANDNSELYYIAYDGTIRKLEYDIDEHSNYIFTIDKCGYIVRGKANDELEKRGDVNLDEKVNAEDALAVLKHAAKKETISDKAIVYADINMDNIIDATDALAILKIAAKIE